MENLERFLRYVKVWTTSDENSGTTPSAEREKDLARILVEELKELGVKDAYMDEWGYVYGHLDGEGDPIGLCSHMDTATNISGKDVKPILTKNYQGQDIKLNDEYVLSPKDFPRLLQYIGCDIVSTSGDTLLGGDDKAGIAIIMAVIAYFQDHPEIKHNPISICFTVDEEIGEGPLHFSIEKMNAKYAYTIDGSEINEIAYENFNASAVHMEIDGVDIHPGEGKGKLLNAAIIFNEFLNTLPENDNPYHSGDRDGFWHLCDVKGGPAHLEADFILRDFDLTKLEARESIFKKNTALLQEKYPNCALICEISRSYYNMYEYIQRDMEVVNKVVEAIKANGLTPISNPIRGGTDGATFSKMGLPTPNLGTGSYNHHSRFEYLVVDEFNKMIDILITLLNR